MVSSFLLVVMLVLALGVAVMFMLQRATKRRTMPGMERTHPRDGNIPDISAAGSFFAFLTNLHKKYGPIASFWLGPQYTVSIASPELFQEHSGPFDRPLEMFDLFKPLVGERSLLLSNKSDARRKRSMYTPSFAPETLKYFYASFNEIGNDLVKKLSAMPKGEHVPIVKHCHTVALKGLTQTSFGDYFRDEDRVNQFRRFYLVCWGRMERLVEKLPDEGSDSDKEFREAVQSMRDIVRGAIDRRRANPTVGHQVLIDVLIENNLPEDELLDDCITFVVGGFHTSGYILGFILYFLSTHQECQEKLYQEINAVIGRGDVDSTHLNRLVYLRQVIEETLRVTVITTYTSRYQDDDTTLGGHFIPKRTPVVQALGVLNLDETIWPHPKKFDPERFSKERLTPRQRASFKPYGFAGKRVCPGQHFFVAEVATFLAILCRAFTFRLVPGQVVEIKHTLISAPKEEIWLTVQRRN